MQRSFILPQGSETTVPIDNHLISIIYDDLLLFIFTLNLFSVNTKTSLNHIVANEVEYTVVILTAKIKENLALATAFQQVQIMHKNIAQFV